jgi:methylenetetrahydrofolate dehydrogenase (NADP+)/methenyltetrahydrofolate cyclohydrolase
MLLNGADIASFIKQRHYQQVRGRQQIPKLVIIQSTQDDAVKAYIKQKVRYAADIFVECDVIEISDQTSALKAVQNANDDDSVRGILVQLPVGAGIDADVLIAAIAPAKDIDGLTENSPFDGPTPMGIMWLLGSYGIEIKDKTAVVVGQGRLVGKPMAEMLRSAGATVIICDESTADLAHEIGKGDIIVTATGVPDLITPEMVSVGAVIIDAGTSRKDGKLVGDVDPRCYAIDSLKVTPTPGGVGPMTVAALFENLLRVV